jgi:acyl-CoA thioester hydrolase
MYNGQYLTLFEIGRTELLRAIGLPYSSLEKSGVLLPVMEAHVFYEQPSFYDDELVIETTFTWEKTASIMMHYRILREEDVIAHGSTKHCFLHAEKRVPVRPPSQFLRVIEDAIAGSAT